MNEPANHTGLIDAQGDTWVRDDERRGRDGANWWPITDGPRWESWGRGEVGIPRYWSSMQEYGPFKPAGRARTARALAKI